jgi:thymidine kinase
MATNPEFIIYTGPMWGGKTRNLINAIDRMEFQNRDVLSVKPRLDHRYADESIVAHTGDMQRAISVSRGQEIIEKAQGFDVVAVDEAFMVDGAATALVSLFKAGKTILVASLQLSAHGKSFSEIQSMLPWATRIEICPAVCSKCDKDAFYTTAKVEGLSNIDIGGAEKYEPRCHEHMTFFEVA